MSIQPGVGYQNRRTGGEMYIGFWEALVALLSSRSHNAYPRSVIDYWFVSRYLNDRIEMHSLSEYATPSGHRSLVQYRSPMSRFGSISSGQGELDNWSTNRLPRDFVMILETTKLYILPMIVGVAIVLQQPHRCKESPKDFKRQGGRADRASSHQI